MKSYDYRKSMNDVMYKYMFLKVFFLFKSKISKLNIIEDLNEIIHRYRIYKICRNKNIF